MWCLLNDVGDKTDKNYISVLSCSFYLYKVQLRTACFGAEAVLLGGVSLLLGRLGETWGCNTWKGHLKGRRRRWADQDLRNHVNELLFWLLLAMLVANSRKGFATLAVPSGRSGRIWKRADPGALVWAPCTSFGCFLTLRILILHGIPQPQPAATRCGQKTSLKKLI